jgi:hypothetical protein
MKPPMLCKCTRMRQLKAVSVYIWAQLIILKVYACLECFWGSYESTYAYKSTAIRQLKVVHVQIEVCRLVVQYGQW